MKFSKVIYRKLTRAKQVLKHIQLFPVIITGESSNSPWHLYEKCFVISLHIDDFKFVAHTQKGQSERL